MTKEKTLFLNPKFKKGKLKIRVKKVTKCWEKVIIKHGNYNSTKWILIKNNEENSNDDNDEEIDEYENEINNDDDDDDVEIEEDDDTLLDSNSSLLNSDLFDLSKLNN